MNNKSKFEEWFERCAEDGEFIDCSSSDLSIEKTFAKIGWFSCKNEVLKIVKEMPYDTYGACEEFKRRIDEL